MRTAFINELIQQARVNDKIFLLVGDLGFSVVEPFAEEFPERFMNVGIAEQNMTGIAAGLALEGFNVFTYSIGNFPTLRCMEQIRYDVCYHNLSVKIVAVGGGYSYGPLGTSHHTTEDIAMLRAIPNMTVCAPGDPYETKKITALFCENSSPGYLRLGKAGEPLINEDTVNVEWGKMIEVIQGSDTVVISTGGMLEYARNHITQNSLNWGLVSCPFIKPLDEVTLQRLSNSYSRIITIEEHQRSAGFGSTILEGVHDLAEKGGLKKIPQITRVAIPDKFIPFAGSQNYLRNISDLHLD